jgi:hypothetical protein
MGDLALQNDLSYGAMKDTISTWESVAFVGSGPFIPIYGDWPELVNGLAKACGITDPVDGNSPVPDLLSLAQRARDAAPQRHLQFLRQKYRPRVTTNRIYPDVDREDVNSNHVHHVHGIVCEDRELRADDLVLCPSDVDDIRIAIIRLPVVAFGGGLRGSTSLLRRPLLLSPSLASSSPPPAVPAFPPGSGVTIRSGKGAGCASLLLQARRADMPWPGPSGPGPRSSQEMRAPTGRHGSVTWKEGLCRPVGPRAWRRLPPPGAHAARLKHAAASGLDDNQRPGFHTTTRCHPFGRGRRFCLTRSP